MSKTNKGGYQIIDFSNFVLTDEGHADEFRIGDIYITNAILSIEDGNPKIEKYISGFSNEFVKTFYHAIVDNVKPKLISGVVCIESNQGYEYKIDDIFIPISKSALEIDASDYTVPLRNDLYLTIEHIVDTSSAMSVIQTIRIYIHF